MSTGNAAAAVRRRWTGVVLAGGASSRMGADKAWLSVGGRPLVVWAAEALRAAGCSELLAVGGDGDRLAGVGLRPLVEATPGQGPLPALAAALAAATHPLLLVVACDMPWLQPAALALVARLAGEHDAAVPRVPPAGWHPLHAAYRRACLPAVRRRLAAGQRRMDSFFADVDVRAVDAGELAAVDPGLISLTNVNTPADLAAARHRVDGAAPGPCPGGPAPPTG